MQIQRCFTSKNCRFNDAMKGNHVSVYIETAYDFVKENGSLNVEILLSPYQPMARAKNIHCIVAKSTVLSQMAFLYYSFCGHNSSNYSTSSINAI